VNVKQLATMGGKAAAAKMTPEAKTARGKKGAEARWAKSRVRCECGAVLGEECCWTGPIGQTVVVEWMPEYLRASHSAARNSGIYPHNGSWRMRCYRECAEMLLDGEDEEWARIVR
jgi:hypothetical protein